MLQLCMFSFPRLRLPAETFSQPIDEIRVDNDKFFDIYGDCYISGFIEGGDLHGIVSIKVLDASSKYNVERA